MFKWYRKFGVVGKVVTPFFVLLPIAGWGLMTYLSNATKENTVNSTVESAKATIAQFKTVRGYYTENVVKKVKKQGSVKVDSDHKGKDDTIPLPATFIHELSEELQKQGNGVKLKLYSDFPFPLRKSRELDKFQKSAIEHLKQNPEDTFVKTELKKGEEIVRVAIADRMVAQGCVSCHNSHPDTPFSDWKMGDVRGILEVETSIVGAMKANSDLMAGVGWSTAVFNLFLLGSVVLIIKLLISRPTSLITKILRKNAQATLSQSDQINDASGKVSQASTEQASAIQETVSTLDQINAMVGRGVDSANRVNELSKSSLNVASNGKRAVDEMVQAIDEISRSNDEIMREINESNERISDIVRVITEISNKTKVINDIVFQTKLLSFNASVEAARAGEHGKGFAVVAEEVGNLARMSGNAAKEIADMLDGSIEKVQEIVAETKSKVSTLVESGKSKVESGVVISKRCGEVLDEVVQNVNQVNQMMTEITTASREQAEGVSNISTAMNELDQSTHINAQVASETAAYAEALNSQAVALQSAVNRLEDELLGNDWNGNSQGGPRGNFSGSGKVVPLCADDGKKLTKAGYYPGSPFKRAVGSGLPDQDDPNFEDV